MTRIGGWRCGRDQQRFVSALRAVLGLGPLPCGEPRERRQPGEDDHTWATIHYVAEWSARAAFGRGDGMTRRLRKHA